MSIATTGPWVAGILVALGMSMDVAEGPTGPPRAVIDGTGPGWKSLGEKDFAPVNCSRETWTWTEGMVHCSGQPVGVLRTAKEYGNFELVARWRHLQSGGNSGIFVWAPRRR